jgi:hypothetical protein
MKTPQDIQAQQDTWELQSAAIRDYRAEMRELYRGELAGRPRLIAALERTATLFEAIGDTAATAVDFSALAVALRDAERGRGHPLIAPAPLEHGRPSERSDKWKLRADAIVAIEFLIAGGQKTGKALAFAANCPGLERLPQNGAALGTSLKSWRTSLKAARETGQFESAAALDAYKAGMGILAALKYTEPPSELIAFGTANLSRAGREAAALP